MGIDYYYLRASYPWPEQSYDPTYPVKWTSQFYTISDVSQVLYLPNLAACDAIDSKETLFDFSDSGNFPPGANPYKQTEYARCSCIKVSNHFSFLIMISVVFPSVLDICPCCSSSFSRH